MNRSEAREILQRHLEKYRSQTYSELASLVNQTLQSETVTAPSGINYNIEVRVMWDGKRGGDLRVSGAIDAGGLRSFFPLVDDFLVSP